MYIGNKRFEELRNCIAFVQFHPIKKNAMERIPKRFFKLQIPDYFIWKKKGNLACMPCI
jgi:hypothetical protein